MTVRRHRTWLLAVLLAAATFGVLHRAAAEDSPVGKTIERIVPVHNKVHTSEQITGLMHSRPGKPYDEAVVQEDIRRLHATKWFTPGSIQVHTQTGPDNKVTVFVTVTELMSTVQEVHYLGAQHISPSELQNITGVRKGEPMNPLSNEIGRQAILRKYQDDGRYFATVELIEGGKPSDTRVVYQVVEGPVVKVDGVEFRGNDAGASGRLKTQLVTKKAFLGTFGGKFNPMMLDVDLKQLTEYYHRLGYLNAKITPEVVRTGDLAKVKLVYHIEEGVQHQVAGVQIDGSRQHTDKLKDLTELQVGARYDDGVAKRDLRQIEDYLGYRGIRAMTEKQIYQDPNNPGLVRVHYVVNGDRGEPDRVGRVIIEGNEVTQDRVIMNQLGLYPGQILQYPMLEDGRMRLARLGIFDQQQPPSVEVMPSEFDNCFKDILVRVRETRTGQFMVGGGVNSNAGLNGSIVLNERNFDIMRFPRSWDDFRQGRAWRGAGQEFRLEAQPGTQFQRYSATFREPYLFDTQFGLTASGYYFNRSYVEYFESRLGGRFTLDRRLNQNWRASLTTRVENVDISNVPYYAPPSITDDIGSHFLLGFRGGLTRDTRDSYLFPTKGNVFDVGVEQVLGDYTFPIGTAEFTQFFSNKHLQREDGSGKHVLALRSQVAMAGANAPVFERFYAGGFRSLRGFTFRGVGPSENDLHTGGTFSFLNTVEYQIPVLQNDKLFFVTFLDHGTVEQNINIKDYRVSAGFGFRIAVPALGPMPIALDFAFPLNRLATDDKQLFSFYVGLFGGN